MASQYLTIDTILGGQSASPNFGSKGQFGMSCGIYPDFPTTDSASDIRTSGYIRPTATEVIPTVTGAPMWIVTNPKNQLTYLQTYDGKIYSLDSALTAATSIKTGLGVLGSGMAYYDNAIYYTASAGKIGRYFPMDGAPAFDDTYWTTTLGKSALTDTTYPSFRGVQLPNHMMCYHAGAKALFIADVISTAASATESNKGCLHKIATTKGGGVEGTNDNGSVYDAIAFDYGWYPTALAPYGTQLAIAVYENTAVGTTMQKRAKVLFWDTANTTTVTTTTDVEFPDPYIFGMSNVNGVLYVVSGDGNGLRLSYFSGGYSYNEIAYLDEGVSFAGAVDGIMNMVAFGTAISYGTTFPTAVVATYGSKQKKLGNGLQFPFWAPGSTMANDVITAVKYVNQNLARPCPLFGTSLASSAQICKLSTTNYGNSSTVYQSELFRFGQQFEVKQIVIPLATTLTANTNLHVKLLFDDGSTTYDVATINSTNYGTKRYITIPVAGKVGQNNFRLSLEFSGTELVTVGLPIKIMANMIAAQ